MSYLENRMKETKAFLATAVGKVSTTTAAAFGAVSMIGMKMYAADAVVGTEVTDSITSSMNGLKTSALIALGSVAAVGIVLFAGPYVWRYGKRVLKTVAS